MALLDLGVQTVTATSATSAGIVGSISLPTPDGSAAPTSVISLTTMTGIGNVGASVELAAPVTGLANVSLNVNGVLGVHIVPTLPTQEQNFVMIKRISLVMPPVVIGVDGKPT